MTTVQPGFIDLFCGAGGMSLGFCLAGYRPLVGVDLVSQSLATYEHNLKPWGAQGICADISEPELAERLNWFLEARRMPRPDVVIAGLPQGAFSLARPQGRAADRTEKQLYQHALYVLDRLEPKIAVLELLGSFEKADRGAHYQRLTGDLAALGYRVAAWTLNAMDFGVPQRRERLYVVATKQHGWLLTPPEPTHGAGRAPHVSTEDALSDLPMALRGRPGLDRLPVPYAGPPNGPYQEAMRRVLPEVTGVWDGLVDNHIAVPQDDMITERLSYIAEGEHLGVLLKNPAVPARLKPRKAFNNRYQRPYKDQPSNSITGHCMEDILHYLEHRGITPREAARLQSFPDWYTFMGPRSGHHGNRNVMDQYEQVGNATPPLLARAIGLSLKFLL